VSLALVVLAGAALALTAAAVSGAIGLAWAVVRNLAVTLEPEARVRAWTCVAMAPAFVAALAVAAGLFASVSGVDHCEVHAGHHPHLCLTHAHLHVALVPALILAVAAVRLCSVAAHVVRAGASIARVTGSLSALPAQPGDVRIVEAPEPFAATLGWWRPRAFVSTAVPVAIRPAVIAHERAHVRHRDPAGRAWVDLVLAFHLPGIAGVIRRGLHRAQEARADADAAREVGDPVAVAEALVGLARLGGRVPRAAVAFEGDVAVRVAELLDSRPRRSLASRWLVAGAVALVAVALVGADTAHHGLETLLGWVGA
jgi:Zn-dependent protease with chaperone function